MEELRFRTRLIWGGGALSVLEELRQQRVLVVSDGFLAKSGLLERVLDPLKGCRVSVFDQVHGEPTLEMVAWGVAALRTLDAQTVVAFGGGSAMDCAKALGWCAGKRLPLWCIPTTAGTGSEVTNFAVLTDGGKGLKYPLVDDALLPEVAILDAQFLSGVPANVTADTGMDVLTHAIEAYTSAKANPFTDAWAEKAVVMAYGNLASAFSGDLAARGELLFASTLAGMAFNAAGLGVCHALAHALGGRLHAPHGRVNAALLPQVIDANAHDPATAKRYARLAGLCGLSPNHRALSGALRRLGRRLDIPAHLPGETDLGLVAADAMKDPCMADNVKPFTEKELEAILREVVG